MRSEAIVLKRFDFSESSQVAHILTRDAGRLSVLARGVKRPNAALKGPIDLFVRARVELRRRRSGLDLLHKYEPITAHRSLRCRLDRIIPAFYLTELMHAGTREADPDPALYDLLAQALAALCRCGRRGALAIVVAAELGYLQTSGFGLAVQHCAQCLRAVPPGRVTEFFPMAGGVLCSKCRPPRVRGERLSGKVQSLLRDLSFRGPKGASTLRPDEAALRQIERLGRTAILATLERPLRSEALLRRALARPRGRSVGARI